MGQHTPVGGRAHAIIHTTIPISHLLCHPGWLRSREVNLVDERYKGQSLLLGQAVVGHSLRLSLSKGGRSG